MAEHPLSKRKVRGSNPRFGFCKATSFLLPIRGSCTRRCYLTERVMYMHAYVLIHGGIDAIAPEFISGNIPSISKPIAQW